METSTKIEFKDINTESLYIGELFCNENGHISCYYGFRPKNTPLDLFSYALSVGFRDNQENDQKEFIELTQGTLVWAYKPFSRVYKTYHLPNYYIKFPSGTQNHYGVYSKNREFQKSLTEELFGFTQNDLEEICIHYAEIMGIQKYKKNYVTFSGKKNNQCDLTAISIPKNFPYISFETSGYIWSHISLFGFYSHLSFLMKNGNKSPLFKSMLQSGVKEEHLTKLFSFSLASTPVFCKY